MASILTSDQSVKEYFSGVMKDFSKFDDSKNQFLGELKRSDS